MGFGGGVGVLFDHPSPLLAAEVRAGCQAVGGGGHQAPTSALGQLASATVSLSEERSMSANDAQTTRKVAGVPKLRGATRLDHRRRSLGGCAAAWRGAGGGAGCWAGWATGPRTTAFPCTGGRPDRACRASEWTASASSCCKS